LAVIGSSSMVGSRFCELYDGQIIEADFKGKVSVDITDFQSVNNFFSANNFDWVVLFSAFTDVDAAEKQKDDRRGSCWLINVEGVKNIINACKKFDRKLIFISTDFVFDGDNGPYSEEDLTGPNLNKVSWYGITKIEAEKHTQKLLKDFIILRITYPYRARYVQKDDIAKRILRLYMRAKLYPMFYDQKTTPTFVDDVPRAIALLVDQNQSGIFHLTSPTMTTQYEFAKKVIEVFGGNPANVSKSSIREFLKKKGSTPRPINGGLKVDKIKSLGFEPTPWDVGINEIFMQSKGKLI